MSGLVGKTIRVTTQDYGVLEVFVLERVKENGTNCYICRIPSTSGFERVLVVTVGEILSISVDQPDSKEYPDWEGSINFNRLPIEERKKEL